MRQIRYILPTMLLMVNLLCQAQTNHYIGIGIGAGEHSLLLKDSEQKGSIGVGGQAIVSYNLQHNHFLMQLGVGAAINHSSMAVGDAQYELLNQQPAGLQLPIDYHYDFSSRKDTYTQVALDVPLMLGAEFGGVYFLLGARLHYNLKAFANTEAALHTYGYNANFLQTNTAGSPVRFENMPNHQFYPEEHIRSGKTDINFLPDVAACAEIGWQWQELLRVAAYVQYGVLNKYKGEHKPLYSIPTAYDGRRETMIDGVALNHVLSTGLNNGVNALEAGVRVTVLLKVASGKRSKYPCMCERYDF